MAQQYTRASCHFHETKSSSGNSNEYLKEGKQKEGMKEGKKERKKERKEGREKMLFLLFWPAFYPFTSKESEKTQF